MIRIEKIDINCFAGYLFYVNRPGGREAGQNIPCITFIPANSAPEPRQINSCFQKKLIERGAFLWGTRERKPANEGLKRRKNLRVPSGKSKKMTRANDRIIDKDGPMRRSQERIFNFNS